MTSSAPTVRRSLVAVGSFLSLVLALLLGTAAPASAHATLLFTSPAADATVADSPKSLVLVFDQPVSLSGSSVRVEPSARLGKAALSQGNQAVTVPVRSALPEGVHTIAWQVTARDGDVMTGSYRFAVGPRTIALTAGQTTATKDATPTAILRWLLFTALAVMLGEAAGRRLTARAPDTPARRPRSWALPVALIGTAAALALAALQLGDGSFSSLTGTQPGLLSLVEVAGFALAAAIVLVRHRALAVVPLATVLVTEAQTNDLLVSSLPLDACRSHPACLQQLTEYAPDQRQHSAEHQRVRIRPVGAAAGVAEDAPTFEGGDTSFDRAAEPGVGLVQRLLFRGQCAGATTANRDGDARAGSGVGQVRQNRNLEAGEAVPPSGPGPTGQSEPACAVRSCAAM